MPELPEVEVLVRRLRPLLLGRVIKSITVKRPKVIRPTSARVLNSTITGRHFGEIHRRAKYLLFELKSPRPGIEPVTLLGHLGMTGRMFVQSKRRELPKHTAVALDLGRDWFVFEDTRYFGRFNLDLGSLANLGPEPLSDAFTADGLRAALVKSSQAIKVKLLDQAVVAGLGNIYASEALFRAGINPRRPAKKINRTSAERLVMAIREVLNEAIQFGSTLPLATDSSKRKNELFYYGQSADNLDIYEERLRVYNRAAQPCIRCHKLIEQFVQAARSTYWCPHCQRQ